MVEVHCPDPEAHKPTKTFRLPELPSRSFRFRSIKSRIKVWARSVLASVCRRHSLVSFAVAACHSAFFFPLISRCLSGLFAVWSSVISGLRPLVCFSTFQREEELARRRAVKEKKKKEREEETETLMLQDTEQDEEDEEEEELPTVYIPDPPSPVYCGFYSQPDQFWLSLVLKHDNNVWESSEVLKCSAQIFSLILLASAIYLFFSSASVIMNNDWFE